MGKFMRAFLDKILIPFLVSLVAGIVLLVITPTIVSITQDIEWSVAFINVLNAIGNTLKSLLTIKLPLWLFISTILLLMILRLIYVKNFNKSPKYEVSFNYDIWRIKCWYNPHKIVRIKPICTCGSTVNVKYEGVVPYLKCPMPKCGETNIMLLERDEEDIKVYFNNNLNSKGIFVDPELEQISK